MLIKGVKNAVISTLPMMQYLTLEIHLDCSISVRSNHISQVTFESSLDGAA